MMRLKLHTLLLAGLGCLLALPSFAVQVKITLSNGKVQYAELSATAKTGVMWTGVDSEIPPRLMPYKQISHIEFPTPNYWLQANQEFVRGDYQKAIVRFLNIANNKEANFHPAPGNYSSLAMIRVIDCCREIGAAEKIVPIAEKLDPASLPPEQRKKLPLINSWVALGKKDWEAALTNASAIPVNPLQIGSTDRGYIRGMALEKLGRIEPAIMAYAEAYTMEFGSRGVLPKLALENATRLLESLDNENRREELRALVHTYAHVHEKGVLWEGAGPIARDLLAEPLDITAAIDKKAVAKTQAPVLNVRFRQGKLVQRGKSRDFAFKPALPALTNKPATPKTLIAATNIENLSAPGVTLNIKAAAKGHGITFQRDHGLGVYTRKGKKADAAIDASGEALVFSMTGVKAFRIASITFGGGDPKYEWNNNDSAKLTVTKLKEGQTAYPASISGKPDDADAEAPSATFRQVPLAGGFISGTGGSFKISHAGGAFGIDAIALEIKPVETE